MGIPIPTTALLAALRPSRTTLAETGVSTEGPPSNFVFKLTTLIVETLNITDRLTFLHAYSSGGARPGRTRSNDLAERLRSSALAADLSSALAVIFYSAAVLLAMQSAVIPLSLIHI